MYIAAKKRASILMREEETVHSMKTASTNMLTLMDELLHPSLNGEDSAEMGMVILI